MKIVQGFVTLNAYVSNTTGIVAPLGELSTNSRTYSKEKKEYIHAFVPGYHLTTFKSTEGITGQEVEIPDNLVLEILTVAQSIVGYATTHVRPYDSEDFQNTVSANLNQIIADLELGDFVSNSTIALPGFAMWKSKAFDYSEIRIWFSDEAFSSQYTGYEITIVPPHPELATFFLPFTQARTRLLDRSIVEMGEEIQLAKLMQPETVIRLMEFEFVNRHDNAEKMKTPWGVLVYGKEGDYIDAIKDAIISYLLSHSTFTQAQWELVFPSIFSRTEMVIVPRWDLMAVENLMDRSSLYSSVVPVQNAMTFLLDFVTFYSEAHVRANSYIVPYPYKSLCLEVVNGSSNILEKRDFLQMYPDYLPIPSTSFDFARMTLPTQQLILFLDDLLLWGEKATPLSTLPSTIRRVIRNNKMFVAATHNGINFLVAVKFNSEFNRP